MYPEGGVSYVSEDPELLAFFKVFGDTERLKIAGMLATQPAAAEDVVAALHLPRADVLHHLGRLEKAGFIYAADGVFFFNSKALEALSRRLLVRSVPLPVGAERLDPADRAVVADFCDADGRLKSLPAQQRKFVAILRYVVAPFEYGARYSEKDVNQILARFHEDTAALRRGLVDYRLMARQSGVYWRLEE
jgi:hypothetical protein